MRGTRHVLCVTSWAVIYAPHSKNEDKKGTQNTLIPFKLNPTDALNTDIYVLAGSVSGELRCE